MVFMFVDCASRYIRVMKINLMHYLSSVYLVSQPLYIFVKVRHPRCVSNKSNCKVYVYIVKHSYVLGGMVFTICKAQLHISATDVAHLQVVQ